jgi:pimeloyl-ACP methyl ester carboxylesterase
MTLEMSLYRRTREETIVSQSTDRQRCIPHAGHNLPQEEPEAFAGVVMELIGA